MNVIIGIDIVKEIICNDLFREVNWVIKMNIEKGSSLRLTHITGCASTNICPDH